MKKFKDIFEVYRPKSPDEQKFVDKHVTIKHKDRNGNGDDVFNGNTKYIKRKEERHGYDVNDDEKVYEEVEELEELSRATISRYSLKAKSIADNEGGKDRSKGRELAGRKNWGGTMKGVEKARVPSTNEEVENLEELSKDAVSKYANRAFDQSNSILKSRNLDLPKSVKKSAEDAKERRRKGIVSAGKRLGDDEMKKIAQSSANRVVYNSEEVEDLGEWDISKLPHEKLSFHAKVPHGRYSNKEIQAEIKRRKKAGEYNSNYVAEEAEIEALLDEALDILLSIDEKTLTPGEMKKREEVVKAIKRGNPKMDKSIAYAIATKTAKRVAEETEELDESAAHDAHFERQTPKVQTHINALLRRGHTYPQAVKKVNGATPLGESSDAYGKSIDDIKKKNITSSDKDKLARLHAMLSAEKKTVKEEVEELDELSSATLTNYVAKASNAKGHRNLPTKKVDNRYIGVKKASDRLNKEEAEQLDELSPKTLSSYAKKAVNQTFSKGVAGGMGLASSNKEDEASGHRQVNKAAKRMAGAQKAISKLTKEDIINRAIENYMPEDYELPSLEERLLVRLEGLTESHAVTLLALFNSLNEENQLIMLNTVTTVEGINELLNFAIENRGE